MTALSLVLGTCKGSALPKTDLLTSPIETASVNVLALLIRLNAGERVCCVGVLIGLVLSLRLTQLPS